MWLSFCFVSIFFLVCVYLYVCVCVKSLQLCVSFCHPVDCSLPDSSLQAIFQAKANWSVLPCLPPGIFSTQGSNLHHFMSSALAVRFFTTTATSEGHLLICIDAFYVHFYFYSLYVFCNCFFNSTPRLK